MSKSHRWAVVITVAVPEPSAVERAAGMIVSLAQPHSVRPPKCHDCGADAGPDAGRECPGDERPGYPTG